MKINELLPIGSIVTIKELDTKFIITSRIAFYTTSDFDLGYVDYKGYEYPDGDFEDAQDYTFNHEDIDEIIFKGYQDEEDKEYLLIVEQNIQDEEVVHLTMDEVNEVYEGFEEDEDIYEEDDDESEEDKETSDLFSKLFNRK